MQIKCRLYTLCAFAHTYNTYNTYTTHRENSLIGKTVVSKTTDRGSIPFSPVHTIVYTQLREEWLSGLRHWFAKSKGSVAAAWVRIPFPP